MYTEVSKCGVIVQRGYTAPSIFFTKKAQELSYALMFEMNLKGPLPKNFLATMIASDDTTV